MSGLPMITFPLMCSISPAGTDESNAEHLITIHETGEAGGLRAFLESPLTEQVTLVLLEDQGFRKFGFDHANRRSFIDYQDDLQARSRGGFAISLHASHLTCTETSTSILWDGMPTYQMDLDTDQELHKRAQSAVRNQIGAWGGQKWP